MKIHITENIENIIEGYNMSPIIYGKVDIDKYPDNSVTEIIAIDAIGSIPVELLSNFLDQVVKKMRMGCTMTIGGIELGLLARNVVNGRVNSETFNGLVFKNKSIFSSVDIVNMLTQRNLVIDNVNIIGNNYEIKTSRPTNKN
jgi:hypothetical protein